MKNGANVEFKLMLWMCTIFRQKLLSIVLTIALVGCFPKITFDFKDGKSNSVTYSLQFVVCRVHNYHLVDWYLSNFGLYIECIDQCIFPSHFCLYLYNFQFLLLFLSDFFTRFSLLESKCTLVRICIHFSIEIYPNIWGKPLVENAFFSLNFYSHVFLKFFIFLFFFMNGCGEKIPPGYLRRKLQPEIYTDRRETARI